MITNHFNFNKIFLYTDSLYSIKSLTVWIKKWENNNWKTINNKPIKNLDLIKPIYDIIKKYNDKIIFKHVKSHTNALDFKSLGNAKADELACNYDKKY